MATKSKSASRKISPSNQRKIKTVRRILDEHGISFEKLILFGSTARGDSRKDSDLDICLVLSNSSKDIDAVRRAANIHVALAGIPADILATTERAWKTDMVSPLLHEIRTWGIEV